MTHGSTDPVVPVAGVLNSKESDIARRELSQEIPGIRVGSELSIVSAGRWQFRHFLRVKNQFGSSHLALERQGSLLSRMDRSAVEGRMNQ